MAEIGFYHLSRSRPDQALGQLLSRSLEAGQRAVLRCRDTAEVRALNAALWKLDDNPWLPHGSKAQGHAAKQPIWLTSEADAPNAATFLFLLSHAIIDAVEDYQRVFVIFDGEDDSAVSWARTLWRIWTGKASHNLSYWQQTARGWTQKAL